MTATNDGIVIFVCEHPDGVDFCEIVPDPPKARPTCTTCGAPALHVGHEAAKRVLDR